jgi:RNA recognition motif-containing protein
MDIYIKNLHPSLDEDHLKVLFEPFGDIISTFIVRDKVTGRSKGAGTIKMHHDLDAQRAIDDMNGREIAGRRLIVLQGKAGVPFRDGNLEEEYTNFRDVQTFKNNKVLNKSKGYPKATTSMHHPTERIDLEVKNEAFFSKEILENGYVKIRFKK